MRVKRAEAMGFCQGVRRAVAMAEAALVKGSLTTIGPLIHNPQETERLARKGVRAQSDPAKAATFGGAVMIRSHGEAPEVYALLEGLGADILDATCPCVKRSQELVRQAVADGYDVVIVGEREHPEVAALLAWAKHAGCGDPRAVLTSRDVEELPLWRKAAFLAQTTLDPAVWERVTAVVKDRGDGEIKLMDTLCPSTTRRIQAAVSLAAGCDAMIVVGGFDSANTRALAEACKRVSSRVHHVERFSKDLALALRGLDKVGITAGASTPDWIIEEVVMGMSEMDRTDVEQTSIPQESAPQEVAGEEINASSPAGEAETPAEPTPVEPADADEDAAKVAAASESFAQAFEKTMVTIRPGQTVNGTIVQITEDEVCVNIGYKVDGIVKKEELTDDIAGLKLGDEIEVDVVKVNDGEGNVICSQRNIVARRNMDVLIKKFEDGELIDGVGKEVVKGGLIADVSGIRAFIPASQVAERYIEKLEQFVGKPLRLKIIEVDRNKRRLVASRKQAMAEETAARKTQAWSKLEVGKKITGTVRRLTDFGAFVDIGGVDGLVHVTDMSWGRVRHPSDVVRVGDELELLVLALDHEKERISLGLKQTRPRPWDVAQDNYPVGAIFSGHVVRIVSFGAFIELEPGLDGLVHISQIAPQRINTVEEALQVGDVVNVKVLEVNPEQKRISLSVRQAYEELGYYDEAGEEAAPEAEIAEADVDVEAAVEAEAGTDEDQPAEASVQEEAAVPEVQEQEQPQEGPSEDEPQE